MPLQFGHRENIVIHRIPKVQNDFPSNSNKSSRDLTFDIARALCMLWIIGVWHIFDYIDHSEVLKTNLDVVTMSVLACFTFISGYFLGKKYSPPLTFYYNRFKRFYVLFVVACILMLCKNQFILSVTGLCNFILPQPYTLWYMAMLLLFYIVTPFILAGGGKSTKLQLLLRGLTTWVMLRVFQYFDMMDVRVPYYFLFYILGLMTTKPIYEKAMNCKYWLLGLSCLTVILCMVISPLSYLVSFFGMVTIIIVSSILKDMNFLTFNRVMAFVAYSSLCAYLYHRPIYRIFKTRLADENGLLSLCYTPLMVLTVIFVSWIIQRTYDGFVLRIFDKIKM